MVSIMKNMKLSTAAVVLLSALGVSTFANAANNFIQVSGYAGAKDASIGLYNDAAMGNNAQANAGNTDITIGGATAIGAHTKADGRGATSVGAGANTKGDSTTALGNGAHAENYASTAAGVASNATGAYSVALGSNSKANSYGAVGIGLATLPDTGATKNNAVSIGAQSGAHVAGGVALGSSSKATIDKGVQGYDPSTQAATTKTDAVWKSTAAAVSVGDADHADPTKRVTRQITGVAAGTKDTDAVNVAQLKALDGNWQTATQRLDHLDNRVNDLNKDLKRGLASQAALSGLFQPYNVGKLNLTAAVGGYKSQTAVAVGTGYRYNENIAAKAGVAFTHGGSATYNAGVNFEW